MRIPDDCLNQLREFTTQAFTLLESENLSRRHDSVRLRLSGYTDTMHLMADIVKVCILAMGEGQHHGIANIPSPETNISGVLGIILDLIPYEESELLDAIRYSVLESSTPDYEFLLEVYALDASKHKNLL